MWRNTGLFLKLGPIDGRAFIFIVVALYSFSWIAFFVCLAGILGLGMLERMGYTIPNALRRLSVLVIGKNRPAMSNRRKSRIDRM